MSVTAVAPFKCNSCFDRKDLKDRKLCSEQTNSNPCTPFYHKPQRHVILLKIF